MTAGEFALIERLAPHLAREGGRVVVGHPDDAAVLAGAAEGLAVSVDLLVDDVHFRRDLSSLSDVGWKAVAVSCSDLAAMGATPVAAVVGLCAPQGLSADDVDELYRGAAAACRRWDLALVGGDTVAGPALLLSVTALGDVAPERALRRSGAAAGDRLVLVGQLGAGAAALAQAESGAAPSLALLAAHRRPRALVAAGQALADAGASACIDVSDGLAADLGHLCAASGVSARLRFDALPVAAGVTEAAHAAARDPVALICGGGEDFALLAAVPAQRAEDAAAAASSAEGVPAAIVGEVVAAAPGTAPAAALILADGSTLELAGMGYEHFRERGQER